MQCCVCVCVQCIIRQAHLQLLISSWLVLLHHKWMVVPSLKQDRKYVYRTDAHLPKEWGHLQTGQLAISTPWQQMSPLTSASAYPSQRHSLRTTSSLLPAQLQVDGNERVFTIVKSAVSWYVLCISFTIIDKILHKEHFDIVTDKCVPLVHCF